MHPHKPLNRKAYGSIGHLPQSRMGPGDHAVSPGMARICCVKTRDKHDRELAKCDVLCSNCHLKVHAEWRRAGVKIAPRVLKKRRPDSQDQGRLF